MKSALSHSRPPTTKRSKKIAKPDITPMPWVERVHCLIVSLTRRHSMEWVVSISLDPAKFGTPSLRRTKAVLIYRRTGNLHAVQLPLGHSKIEI
jgi:hypothetical protein